MAFLALVPSSSTGALAMPLVHFSSGPSSQQPTSNHQQPKLSGQRHSFACRPPDANIDTTQAIILPPVRRNALPYYCTHYTLTTFRRSLTTRQLSSSISDISCPSTTFKFKTLPSPPTAALTIFISQSTPHRRNNVSQIDSRGRRQGHSQLPPYSCSRR